VKQVCMSLITLKEPVKFGNETNDPVKLVIEFGAIDNHTHLQALSQLMNLFTSKKYTESVINTLNINEVLKIINNCSNMEVNIE
ncbi:MAG: mannitol operon transcriptional activator, partial [Thermoanaerobacteraceae bacterium]|nr:mannitol operon transcriptional activator [Thermoanaerobacteraceae bacterium]